MVKEKITFSFGKNWSEFIKKHFSEERVAVSRKHILNFLKLNDLRGKYFLDIGCGSGLQSLSAYLFTRSLFCPCITSLRSRVEWADGDPVDRFEALLAHV